MSGVYSTREAFNAYRTYLALKQHFTSNYDYFRYNGKVSATVESFETRKDKFHFYKLSKKKDYQKIILANFIADGGKKWIGDILSTDADDIYSQWLKRQQSLSYSFKRELSTIDDIDAHCTVKDGQHPPILEDYLRERISIETLIICDDLLKIFEYWNRKINVQIIWNDVYFKIQKYKPFLHYDRESMKKIMLDQFG